MTTSYNGWPASATLKTRRIVPVAGSGFTIVDDALVDAIFTYLVQQFDARVERVVGGVWDDWGYDFRRNVNNPSEYSCHASGTALDINATQHPNGTAAARTFSQAEINEVNSILTSLEGTVRWLSGYDPMHFEIAVTPARLWLPKAIGSAPPEVRPDVPTPAAPSFPLPGGRYYGPYEGPDESISGSGKNDAPYRPGLQRAQAQLNAVARRWGQFAVVSEDGYYGPATAAAIKGFQRQANQADGGARLVVDGLLGAATWRRLFS